MENIPAVSVIIPMYNVEKYIAECLDSVLMQTLQDFEVIVVNDCSTDNSRAIAESYLDKFGGRMKLFDNEKNSGAAATRNNGLRRATGEYVFFMDADDLLLLNGLEKLYALAKNFDVDFINLTKSYDMSNDGKSLSPVHLRLTRPSSEPILETNLKWRIEGILEGKFTGWAPWRRLLRRNFLIQNEIFFPEQLVVCEDEVWTHGLLLRAKKILHMPLSVYLHRMSDNSLTRKKRLPLQNVNFRVSAIIYGMKWIDEMMDGVPFFKENSYYRYDILKYATCRYLAQIYKSSLKVLPTDMFRYIKQEFRENLGEQNVSTAILFTVICNYQKNIEKNERHIAELEKQLKAKLGENSYDIYQPPPTAIKLRGLRDYSNVQRRKISCRMSRQRFNADISRF